MERVKSSIASVSTSGSRPPAPLWWRVVQTGLSLGIVVGIFVGILPVIADYNDVFKSVEAMSVYDIAFLVAIALLNLGAYWFVLTAALPGLRVREAAVVNQASTAVSNTLPAGGAVGVGVTVAMLTSWGFTIAAIGRSAVVTGIWNNFVKLGMPLLALALVALEGGITPARLLAAVAGVAVLVGAVVILAAALRSDRLARAVGAGLGKVVDLARRVARKEPLGGWEDRSSKFRTETAELLAHRWVWLTSATLMSHVSLYLVLLVALREVGVSQAELSWIAVLAAFAFVRLISALPLTPGGVGIVELGYAAALTIGLDEVAKAKVVAAILVFRAVTYILPIPLGMASYGVWRANRSWRVDEQGRAWIAVESRRFEPGTSERAGEA